MVEIGSVVQRLERWCDMPEISGSNPVTPTINLSLTNID